MLALREKSALGVGFFDIVLLSFQSPPFVDCPVKQLSGERDMIDDGAQIMREFFCALKLYPQEGHGFVDILIDIISPLRIWETSNCDQRRARHGCQAK